MLNLGVLVLNRSYLPIHVTTVRRAFALVYQGAAHVVDSEYRSYAFDEWFALAPEQGAETIGTSRGPIPVPKVIVLRSYDRMPRRHVRFSRANVFARDEQTLNKKPARPRWTPLASLPLASHRHDEWRPFLRVVDRSEAREPIAV